MNSTQINCFLEAAKCRSFSKSAANLFISQSTFSRNISMLEEELGLTLFSRNSFHGIELTESGKIMEEALTNGRKIYLAAIEKARQLEHEAHTHLTLGLLEGQLLDDTLGALISRFRMSFLNVTFSIRRDTYNRLISSLQSGETDIVYMPEWQFQDIDQLQVMKLGELETLLVVPKRLISPPEDRVYSLTEFSNLPFITINDNDSSTPGNMLRELFDSLRISPPVTETTISPLLSIYLIDILCPERTLPFYDHRENKICKRSNNRKE